MATHTNSGVAVVTGASSGLGAVFARKLAARGHSLLLSARREDRLLELAAELRRQYSVEAGAVRVDLSVPGEIEGFAADLAADSRVTMLVNNAGFGTKGRFWETNPNGQEAMHNVHVMAAMKLTRAVLPGMVERNRGAVINVSSVAGFARSQANVSYCATKAWMNAFTEGLYLELKGAGSDVRVQALCPGFTYTEFHDVMGVDRNKIARSLWMKSEDVVEASLQGLEDDKLFVIPGWRYKLIVALLTKLPTGLRLRVEARSAHTSDRL